MLLLVILVFPLFFRGQEPRTRVLVDTTKSGYENLDNAGGPKTIGAQLNADNQQREFYFRIPIRVTSSWYEWKKKLNEQTGIQLGINYTSLFLHATPLQLPQRLLTSAREWYW